MATTRRGATPQLLAIAGALGVLDAYLYLTLVVQPGWVPGAALHHSIVDGTAMSPYRYRVLVPFITDLASKVIGLERAYDVFYFAVFPLALCSLVTLLRRWYPSTLALLGTTFVAAVLPLSFRDHYFQPATWLELVLVIVALGLLAQDAVDLRWYAAVSIVAAVNRETGVLLGLLLVLATWPVPHARRPMTAVVALAPAATYLTIHALRGSAPAAEHDLLSRNLHDLPTAVVQIALFAGSLVLLAAAAWRRGPDVLRRATWLVPPYVALVGVFGVWRQVRLLVPLLPIAIGLALGELRRLDELDGAATTASGPTTGPDTGGDHSERRSSAGVPVA